LSRFLRDYLYIPLGGNAQGTSRRYLTLSMTMLLGGLWHGASWTFVAWGGLHGLYLMINHAWRALKVRLGWGDGGIMARIAGILLTFAAINVAWVFFRAESFETAVVMLKTMAGLENLSLPASLSALKPFLPAGVRWNGLFADHALPPPSLAWMAALLAVAWICPNTQTIMRAIEPSSDWHPLPGSRVPAWQPGPAWAMAGAVCLTVSLLSLSRISEFIYFNF
ncbi:MAG: hypothetical protein K2Q10_04670, partial [Rhodospirillales bacterium]|nr:hypothetical protein [Rhodospirillales bacterium]